MSEQAYTTFRVRVLLVDDERALLEPMREFLSRYYSVEAALSGNEALQLVESQHGEFDVALIDESLMPGPSGIEVMKTIRASYPNMEVIIFTGWGSEQRQNALRAGAFRYLEKPVNKEELVLLIRSAAQQVRFHAINREMLASRGLDGLQNAIINAACSLVFADDAAIVYTNPLSGKEVIHKSNAAEHATPCFRHHLENTDLTRKIMQEGVPFSLADTDAAPKVAACLKEAGFRAFIGLPIPGEVGTQGVLYVYSRTSHHFDELGHTALLRTIAAQAGLALTNAWAEEQLRLHSHYMDALVRASRELSAVRSQQEMFEIALRFVQEKLGISIFYIALFDEKTSLLSFPLYCDQGVLISRPTRTLDTREKWGVTGYVIYTGEEVFWPNLLAEDTFCKEKQITLNIHGTLSKSCFFYPLIIDDHTGGVISVQSQNEGGLPSLYLDALRALGNHLCVTIKNIRLQEEETRRRTEAEELHKAAQTISKSIEPKLVINQILNCMRKVVPFDYATVQLIRRVGSQFYFELTDVMGFHDLAKMIGKTFPVDGRPVYRRVYAEKRTIIIRDVSDAPGTTIQHSYTHEFIHSWMGVPLLVDNDLIGIITLNSLTTGFYSEHHANLAEMFAMAVAQAVNNASHHEHIEHTKRLLEAVTEASRHIRSETEPQRLLFETVHQAAELMGFAYGALFYFNPFVQELELMVSYNLPESLNSTRFSALQGLAGKAALMGCNQTLQGAYQNSYPQDPILAGLDIQSALAIPIKHPNETETKRVLLLADEQPGEVSEADMEVLEKLIDQAAIAIRTSTLISGEKNRFDQLTILQKIYEFIQTRRELDDILHLVLTGITAGYGLAFNRAVLLFVDYSKNGMVGKMAIGCLDMDTARLDWVESRKEGLDDFASYLNSLNQGTLSISPLHEAIAGKLFTSPGNQVDTFLTELKEHRSLRIDPADLLHFPDFVNVFQPSGKMVAVPLMASEELVGIILVDNKFNMAPISAEAESELLTFANVAGLAIENERLWTKLRQTRDAAVEVTKVSVLGNLKESLAIIRESARQVLSCNMFTLYIYDAKTGKFTGREHFGSLDDKHIRMHDQLRISSSVYKVIELTRPNYHFTENSQHDPYFEGTFAEDEKIQATLAIKLTYHDEPLGALFINYRAAHHFTEEEINTALLFADQAAIAIQNARLYSQVEQQTKYLHQLYEAGKIITSSLSLQDTLQRLAELARHLTGVEGLEASFCNVLLEEGGMLRFVASAPEGHEPGPNAMDPNATPCGITGRAYLSGSSELARDVHQHPDYIEFDTATMSELAVPMKSGEKIIGVINLENNRLEAFDKNDMRNLELLAAQAAIAIQNARAYDEIRKAQGIIGSRTALVRVGMIASVWQHSIEKDALTIRDQAGLLRKNLDKLSPLIKREKMMLSVDMIERLAKQILAKPITGPLSNEEGVEPVLVNSLVKERTTQLWERPDYPPVTYELVFDLNDEIQVWAAPEWLRRALEILIENAVREVRQCPVKHVVIGTRQVGPDQLEIYVSDSGRGIPPEIWSKLGEEFLPRPPGSDGMGIGLMFAQIIVGTYNGSLVKIKTGANGTQLGFRLPIHMGEEKG